MLKKKGGKKLIFSGSAEKLRFRNESIYLSWGVKVSNIIAIFATNWSNASYDVRPTPLMSQ